MAELVNSVAEIRVDLVVRVLERRVHVLELDDLRVLRIDFTLEGGVPGEEGAAPFDKLLYSQGVGKVFVYFGLVDGLKSQLGVVERVPLVTEVLIGLEEGFVFGVEDGDVLFEVRFLLRGEEKVGCLRR